MYKRNSYNFFFQLILLFVLTTGSTWASLFIAPTRVIINERERSTTIALVNTSDKTNTYRLRWMNQKQDSDGEYIPVSESDKSFPIASNMLRFSPRQVTLKPGERQVVRIAVRRKKGMKNGDYRSHLVFQKLPNVNTLEPAIKGSKFDIRVNIGFSIPVTVRQGKFSSSAKINEIDFLYLIKNKEKHFGANVFISRQGDNSVYGSLKVFWKKRLNDKYKQIARLNNVAIYRENTSQTITIGFTDFNPEPGFIQVTYTGTEDLENKVSVNFERKMTLEEFKLYTPKH